MLTQPLVYFLRLELFPEYHRANKQVICGGVKIKYTTGTTSAMPASYHRGTITIDTFPDALAQPHKLKG